MAKKYFAGDNVIYVDLAYIHNLYNDIVIPEDDQENCTLLLDNAQLFNEQFNFKNFRLIIAAYSPNAEVTSNNTSVLAEHCGRSMISENFTPFTKGEMENLIETRGYQTVNDVLPITSELPDGNEKNIQQHQFDRLMFITNGNPRYMYYFLLTNHFGSMKKEVLAKTDTNPGQGRTFFPE